MSSSNLSWFNPVAPATTKEYTVNINYEGTKHTLKVEMKIDPSYARRSTQPLGGRNIPYKSMDQFVQRVRGHFNLAASEIIIFTGPSKVDGSETHLNMFDIIDGIVNAPESNPATFTLVKVPMGR